MCPESGGSLDKSHRFLVEAELVFHTWLQKKGGACPTVVLLIGAGRMLAGNRVKSLFRVKLPPEPVVANCDGPGNVSASSCLCLVAASCPHLNPSAL